MQLVNRSIGMLRATQLLGRSNFFSRQVRGGNVRRLTENRALSTTSNKTKTLETNLQEQFQLLPGVELALPAVKASDIAAMAQLSQEKIGAVESYTECNPYVMTDIGSSDGQWTSPFFLKQFETAGWLMVNAVEPVAAELQKYRKKLDEFPRSTAGVMLNAKLEDAALDKLPKANFTLCSHSLYYSKDHWENFDGPLSEHLFTKLLSSLKASGSLCVILQSGDTSLSPGQYGIHAELEDITYPIMFRLEGKGTEMRHQDHVTYTTAEKFKSAMAQYAQRLFDERDIDLDISSALSVSQVALGNVNCSAVESNGEYVQSDSRAQRLLHFYTKKHYKNYTPEEQWQLLNFFEDRCKTPEGNYVMTHLNKAFFITANRPLAEVCKEDNVIKPISTRYR